MAIIKNGKQISWRDLGDFDEHGRSKRYRENLKEQEERLKEEDERIREEHHRSEQRRIQKLEGKSEWEYCLERLIELAITYEGKEKFKVSASDLGFPATIGGAIECHKFLNKLKEMECFEKVEKLSDNITFEITKPNVEKLKDYRIELKNQKERMKRRDKPLLFKEKEIKKITLIETSKNEYLLAINENYQEVKKVPKYSEWWDIFINEIKNRDVPYEKRINTKKIPKEMADFFNYNKKCGLYFGGKYKLTNIFIGRGMDIRINPAIKTEIISEKQYQRRKQRIKK